MKISRNAPMSKMKPLRIGIVCPYGWDAPGGVQNHVRDLAEYLIAQGHVVSVLAPAVDEDALPAFVVSAGKPIAIPYNGAVARVLFGPVAFARVRQWINQGNFDLLHLHEPAIPSLSLLACWAAEGPMVGTFHAASKKQRAIFAVGPILEPVIEKLSVRIAVSESARLTLTEHLETDAIVIPNGIFAEKFRNGSSRAEWSGKTVGFIGRFEEPRKGLSVLLEALPIVARSIPDVRVLVAGPGESDGVMKEMDSQLRGRVSFLGRLSDEDKADFLSSVSLYAAVVASDIPAFASLLGDGMFGVLFESENAKDLAQKMIALLRDDEKRIELSLAGQAHAKIFDWDNIAEQIFSVYEMAMVGSGAVRLASDTRSWSRLLNRRGDA
jgi:phosphatidylinositol alpha-mannosyltransferase